MNSFVRSYISFTFYIYVIGDTCALYPIHYILINFDWLIDNIQNRGHRNIYQNISRFWWPLLLSFLYRDDEKILLRLIYGPYHFKSRVLCVVYRLYSGLYCTVESKASVAGRRAQPASLAADRHRLLPSVSQWEMWECSHHTGARLCEGGHSVKSLPLSSTHKWVVELTACRSDVRWAAANQSVNTVQSVPCESVSLVCQCVSVFPWCVRWWCVSVSVCWPGVSPAGGGAPWL